MIYPILNERALYDESLQLMILGDLHLGIELEFEANGILIPDQTQNMLDRVLKLINLYNIKKLIILGDIKHTLFNLDFREIESMARFFRIIKEKTDLEIVPGNHDGSLKRLFPDLKIRSSRGVLYNSYYLMHGHTWPTKELEKAKFLIMAHIHPEIKIRDAQGHSQIETCWLRGKPEKKIQKYFDFDGEIIILPSFNTLTGRALGEDREAIGPLFGNNLLKVGHMDVYLLDGTNLGKALKKF
jgi:hypothetical protein